MIPLTEETAAAEKARLLSNLRHYRRAATRAKRALDRLEADCRRHGIRFVREPVRAPEGGQTHAGPDPDPR